MNAEVSGVSGLIHAQVFMPLGLVGTEGLGGFSGE